MRQTKHEHDAAGRVASCQARITNAPFACAAACRLGRWGRVPAVVNADFDRIRDDHVAVSVRELGERCLVDVDRENTAVARLHALLHCNRM